MIARLAAWLVHLLTAIGAAIALLALDAAAEARWQAMFVWLGVAMIVDGIDGPLARSIEVDRVLPRFSGTRLDLIVDYLNYVAVPAFALTQAEILPEDFRVPAAIAVLLSSLFHVANRDSKTADGYFVGFPAIWNVVLLYVFVFAPEPPLALAFVGVLVVLIFVPALYVHPLRVRRLRAVTIAMTVVWAIGAVAATAHPFPSPAWIKTLLLIAGAYFVAISAWRSLGTRP